MSFTEIEKSEGGTFFGREIKLSLGSSKFQMSMRSPNRTFSRC